MIEKNKIKYYALSIDLGSSIITDFGGHRENVDNDLIDTAIREYGEECYNVFGKPTREEISKSVSLSTNETIEYIYKVPNPQPLHLYSQLFDDSSLNDPNKESYGILWLTKSQLCIISTQSNLYLKKFQPHAMYDRLNKAIQENINKL